MTGDVRDRVWGFSCKRMPILNNVSKFVINFAAQPSTGLLRACGSLPRESHFAVLE